MTTTNVLTAMFKHLTASYSVDEARDILMQKYPDSANDIELIVAEAPVAQNVADAIETETKKLETAVKQKTAKPKKEKVAKATSKMARARELYEAAEDKSRKAMIEVFGKELGLSVAGASTYYYNVKS
jgi:hypothetical protein